MIISTDANKAFGENQHPFTIKTLRKIGNNIADFRKLIKNIYKKKKKKKHIANITLMKD